MSSKQQQYTAELAGVESGDDESTEEYKNPETLRRLYHEEGLSLSQVGERLGVSDMTILRYMDKYRIEKRQANQKKQGCFRTSPDGYNLFQTWNPITGKRDAVRMHRLYAAMDNSLEEMKGKHVHHKNGHKLDNRRENLELLTPEEHAKRHAEYDGSTEYI